MPIAFFSCYEKTINKCRYGTGKNNKKNFGKIRPIERNIDQSFENKQINEAQKQQLQRLCSTIRNWLNNSLSHKHRFKGVELYETMSQIAEVIPILRAVKDHEVLEQLQHNLMNSLAGLEIAYEALKQGGLILAQLTDLLYDAKNEKGIRLTQAYKEKMDSHEIKQQVEQLLEKAHQQHKKHSSQMRAYLKHFQDTYQNWNAYLFTCYDYPIIPNDNNRLELSHSQMKKQHRRITGQKCTANYLKIHGEQAAFMLAYSYANNSQEELIELFRRTNPQLLKEQKQRQLLKSQARGQNFATTSKLDKTIREIKELWVS